MIDIKCRDIGAPACAGDMKSQIEPDEIEQQIIATLYSVLQEDELWADNRSYLTRMIGQGKLGAAAVAKNAINEELWKKTFITRLAALGRRLHFVSDGAESLDV